MRLQQVSAALSSEVICVGSVILRPPFFGGFLVLSYSGWVI